MFIVQKFFKIVLEISVLIRGNVKINRAVVKAFDIEVS